MHLQSVSLFGSVQLSLISSIKKLKCVTIAFLQTFDEELLAEPPEGVLLHVGQPGRILASAQVECGCVVLGKKCLHAYKLVGLENE